MTKKTENATTLALPKEKYALFNGSTVQGGKSLIAHMFIFGYQVAHGELPEIIDLDDKHKAMGDTFKNAKTLNISDVAEVFDIIAETDKPVIVIDCSVGSTPAIFNAASTKKKGSSKSYSDFYDILTQDCNAKPIWFVLLDNDYEKSMASLIELQSIVSQIVEVIPSFKMDVVMVYNKGHWETDEVYGGLDGLTQKYITNQPQVITEFINKPFFNVLFQSIDENITQFADLLKKQNLSEVTGDNVLSKRAIRKTQELAKNFYLAINNKFLK